MKSRPWLAPLAVFAFAAAVLLSTLPDYGVTWDEAYPNLPAARRHAEWFAGLFSNPSLVSEGAIKQYWESTSDHPTLVRSVAALGILALGGFLPEPTAARVPLVLAFSVFLAVQYEWVRRRCGSPWPALWSVLALLLLPRVFAHAHFAALDLPMAMMWVAMLWIFLWASGGDWNQAAVAGLFYGLCLATKLHAFFIPLVLIAHNLRFRRFDYRMYVMMALLGPIVYVLVQPLLWHHPIATTMERLAGLSSKVESGPIPLYYLGSVHVGDTPWHYPLIMTLVTFPLPILGLLLVALADWTGRWWARGGPAVPAHPPTEAEKRIAAAIAKRPRERGDVPRREWVFTLVASVLVSYGLVLLPKAQAYDGLRLLLPGVLSLVVLSTLGFTRLSAWCVVRLARLPWPYLTRMPALLALALAIPGAWSTARLHPWQTSHYNLLGSAIGLDQFENGYWCEGLNRTVLADLNQRLRHDSKLWVMASSSDQIAYYQFLGWMRADVQLPPVSPPFDYHLMQVRQGMFSQLGWALYRHGRRLAEYGPPGRPVYILYGSLEEALGASGGIPGR